MASITQYREGNLSAAISCLLCLALIFGPDPMATTAFESWALDLNFCRNATTSIWLTTYLIANIISVRFVRKYHAARWVLVGFILSHVWAVAFSIMSANEAVFFAGLCFCWAGVALAMYVHRREIRLPSVFGIWVIATLLLYIIAIKFEVKDVFVWSAAYPFSELS